MVVVTVSADQVLTPLRARIDAIDTQIVGLLAERMACVSQVIGLKTEHGLPARIDARIEEVVAHVRAKADAVGAPPDLAETVWRGMIEWVIAYEERHLNPGTMPRADKPESFPSSAKAGEGARQGG